ncbi:MAG: PLP-dependent transferase, partial [Acidobacteria bacterium]|nr:PLP-dependent transferase [Acidobacteriota bacterium]
ATHRELSPAKRAAIGITEGLIRVSVGIEDVNDIVADIEQALRDGEEFSRGFSQITLIEEAKAATV